VRAADVLEYLARALVDQPDEVRVFVVEDDDPVTLELEVAPDDLGKVIGKRGRTAKALRTVVRQAASLDDHDVNVEIID
jgi:predicted RNA-binding protein YlqC (UPF0109 family)